MTLIGGTPGGPGDPPDGPDLEGAIVRVAGIHTVRVVQEPAGRISEVHVLATRERSPKQIVRDIQSVLLAQFGVKLDYRTVSVVQLADSDTSPGNAAAPARVGAVAAGGTSSRGRPAIARVVSESEGTTSMVTIDLTLAGETRSGSARGPATLGPKLVAMAIIDAVGGLVADSAATLEFADVLPVGGRQVALVVLRLGTARGDHVVSGSAPVRKDVNDAVARAALAALNRLMESG